MVLPYIVDVKSIDPPTDNMYPHLNRRFEWIIKADFQEHNISRSYTDIEVIYDFNLTNLRNFPKVQGKMSISDFPIMGGDELTYTFTWENTGNETAYDINMTYNAFAAWDPEGIDLLINNPLIEFIENKTVYWNLLTGEIEIEEMGSGDQIMTIEGWYQWKNNGTWLGENQTIQPDLQGKNIGEFLENNVYISETFMYADLGDFNLTTINNRGHKGLTTTIDSLAPGEQIAKNFSIKNFPDGTFTLYSPDTTVSNESYIKLEVNETIDLETAVIENHEDHGLTLHLPEDQIFNFPVTGAKYHYHDGDGKEYLGMTNGLVIQLYDDEAILVGNLTLDRDIYRVDDQVTYTLELENIGNADATDIDVQLFHAFLNENFELQYIQPISNCNETISSIAAGESETVMFTSSAETQIGLHPVFAVYDYTSNETIDPDYDFFGECDHTGVHSSMDYGIVLPPLRKEGKIKPTYPTPEVTVTSELLNYSNETVIGDTVTLQTTITNTGDEDTNIIYIQRLPYNLEITDLQAVNITVDGKQITDKQVYFESETIGMGGVVVFDHIDRGIWGIPLGINETMTIEIDLEVTDSGEIFIPGAEIRYRSRYNMTVHSNLQERDQTNTNTGSSTTEESDLTSTINSFTINSFDTQAEEDFTGQSTNDWGSYADSLIVAVESFKGFNYWLIGIGLIAVTSVAVLIYFKANGKNKH
jgi:hypothetical protein